jgi:hypothetical protein
MSMILRYGATQKQRLGRHRTDLPSIPAATPNLAVQEDGAVPELDQVDAMVERVKSRGVSVAIIHVSSSELTLVRVGIFCDMLKACLVDAPCLRLGGTQPFFLCFLFVVDTMCPSSAHTLRTSSRFK